LLLGLPLPNLSLFSTMLSWLTMRELFTMLKMMRMGRLTWKGTNLMKITFTGSENHFNAQLATCLEVRHAWSH